MRARPRMLRCKRCKGVNFSSVSSPPCSRFLFRFVPGAVMPSGSGARAAVRGALVWSDASAGGMARPRAVAAASAPAREGAATAAACRHSWPPAAQVRDSSYAFHRPRPAPTSCGLAPELLPRSWSTGGLFLRPLRHGRPCSRPRPDDVRTVFG
ncbi:unnamed protein product [Urochloa humidicola]